MCILFLAALATLAAAATTTADTVSEPVPASVPVNLANDVTCKFQNMLCLLCKAVV